VWQASRDRTLAGGRAQGLFPLVGLDECAQGGVDPGLIAAALALEPVQDVGIDAQGDLPLIGAAGRPTD
jgi:hypothetical protein